MQHVPQGLRESLLARAGQPGPGRRRHGNAAAAAAASLLRVRTVMLALGIALAAVVWTPALGPAAADYLAAHPFKWFSYWSQDTQPFCRKSSSVVVLPAHDNGTASGSGGAGCGSTAGGGTAVSASWPQPDLVVWSGMGKHKAIINDLHSFSLGTGEWRVLRQHGDEVPVTRWKAGNAQAVDGGLVVVGGDAYVPHTRKHTYNNDVWWLDYESLRWSQAAVEGGAPIMAQRRGHSTLLYRGDDGIGRIVVFGGRTRDKELLNDVWEVALSWAAGALNATWRLVAPQLPAGEAAPEPRRGHSAVLVPDPVGPQMLVYGGLQDVLYYSDLWLLDIMRGLWRQVKTANEAPTGRDHHSVAYVDGLMAVWAGHSGPEYCHARPVDDLLVFDLHTRMWRQLAQHVPCPLPRFEQAYAVYTPPAGTGPRLLIFGGQTWHVCQLNDVWELDLAQLGAADGVRWRQLSEPHFCTSLCRKRYGR